MQDDQVSQGGGGGEGQPEQRETQEAPRPDPSPVQEAQRPPEVVHQPEAAAGGKADLTKRAVAGIIDGVIAGVCNFVPIVGGIVGGAYILLRDGLELDFMPHQSIGKKLAGLQAVTVDGEPLDMKGSVMRNWPFAFGVVASILMWIPIIGWILAILLTLPAVALGLLEVFLVVTDKEGRRLGDKTGNSKVIEVGGGKF